MILHSDDEVWQKVLNEAGHILNALFIVSSVDVSQGLPEGSTPAGDIPVNIKITKADGKKCQRCWNYSPSVGTGAEHPDLCARCISVIKEFR